MIKLYRPYCFLSNYSKYYIFTDYEDISKMYEYHLITKEGFVSKLLTREARVDENLLTEIVDLAIWQLIYW